MSVEEFYGRWAGLYDRLATAPGVARWRAAAARDLDLSRGDTVVEMGCGTGANFPFLRSRVGPEGRVVGVDVTRPLLERARQRIDRSYWRNVHVVHSDATRPPLAVADAILGTFVVGMFDAPGDVVADWCERCDGRVALLDAASTEHPAGVVLNPLFGAFVAAGTPADSLSETLSRLDDQVPRQTLDRRVRDARDALADRTVDWRSGTQALGLIQYASGRVP